MAAESFNGQYSAPPFGMAGVDSTGAGGSPGMPGLVDAADPMVGSYLGNRVQQPGSHGLALAGQVHDGFSAIDYVSTGAGQGNVVGAPALDADSVPTLAQQTATARMPR
jgi:hypothetical protein